MDTTAASRHSSSVRRTAVVTGAAQGIGQALCVALARRGDQVVGVDVAGQTDTGDLVRSAGGAWSCVQADVTDIVQVNALAEHVADRFDHADILINNAAIDDPINWSELDLDRWRRVLAVNLEAPFLLCKAFVPQMAARGWGRIVNIGSGSVLNPMPKFVAYRTAKMGIVGFARALATEVGDLGITVNVVSPGITRTPMVEAGLPPGSLESAAQVRAIKRVAEPADLAGAVVFLTGEDSGFITGQTLLVNGGTTFG